MNSVDHMKQMIVRNMPDDLNKDLRRIALEADISLNALVLQILAETVEKARAKGKISGGRS